MSNVAAAPPKRSLKRVAQRTSHAHLSQDVSGSPAPPAKSRSGRLDAIIVPASRPASFLQPVIDLAASLNVLLVILCSRQTRVEHVAQRVSSTPGAKSLIVPIPEAWTHSRFPTRTSGLAFANAKAGRESDLSLKRNLGLVLARLHGWNKIAFIDDDVRLSKADQVARLAGQLDSYQIAGMVVRRFPDNSVVCHARRLADLSQDVFLTGAVLGVHCNNLPLSFFPDIYNEDWFFFAEEAATRRLRRVGQAVQEEYDPFASPNRAGWEEFGDLLAEGMFALFGEGDPTVPFVEQICQATRTFWDRFIEARREVMTETSTVLRHFADGDPGNRRVHSALDSLAAAQSHLDTIRPDLCVDFLDAYLEDLRDWQEFTNSVNNVGGTCEAMDFLELRTWQLAEFGSAEISVARGVS